MSNQSQEHSLNDIAIIGMAGRFPKAPNLQVFWENLCAGVEAVSHFSDAELAAAGVSPRLLQHPRYVKAGVLLEAVDQFDAAFFGIPPREAEIMDPQHRLFLECAWETLEDAGYNPETYEGAIGVFASTLASSYMLANLSSNRDLIESVGALAIRIANDRDFLPMRVSYKLNLRGPSLCVQTACSSSLVACHLACQSLLEYQCDIALCGAVALNILQATGYIYHESGIYSPDGHCRAFDADARGTVAGSGVGIVALKRLEDALADGDTIHAIIKASALNNDGALKVGYTAPSVDGQLEVITLAQALAKVDPASISYIEAHGTGTALGDPIEITALSQAFREHTDRTHFCAIGSIKTNIGHLDAAAGIAGLIKTVLALEHRTIPPSLNYRAPNPEIDFAGSPFYVNTQLCEWTAAAAPRRAGVSSFAVGGTNAHVVLEEAPLPVSADSTRPWHLLTLSARTVIALDQAAANLAAHLRRHPELHLADVASTLQIGRKAFEHRRFLVCSDTAAAAAALERRDALHAFSGFQPLADRSVIFMFPGQGAQYVNMGLELYRTERIFQQHVDRCAEFLAPHLGLDLREVIYPDLKIEDRRLRIEGTESSILHPPSSILDQTQYAQPSLFAIEYALAQLWMSWGVQPQAMIGHSIGEYVAACLAGVLSLDDALRLVMARARLMQTLPRGAMLNIPLPEAEILALLDKDVSLAAVNGPATCAVAGPVEAIDRLHAQLHSQGIESRRLHTSHAFHSSMMDPILQAFSDQVSRISLHPPQIPYVSNVTGTWMTAADATNPGYWVRHLRQTVRFSQGLTAILRQPPAAALEVGPGRTLSSFARQHLGPETALTISPSMRHPQEPDSDAAFLLTSLGKLWLAGVPIQWCNVYADEQRRRVSLPTYPFERKHYWVDPARQRDQVTSAPLSSAKQPIDDWLCAPVWKETVQPSSKQNQLRDDISGWLIFECTSELSRALVTHLTELGGNVVVVRPGDAFHQLSEREYVINPTMPADYQALLQAVFADRQPALAPPSGHGRPELQNQYVAPRDQVEQRLAEIWQALLGIAPIGVYDTFFELGGDSLLATQFVSRIRDTFHTDLSLSAFFKLPTIADIARHLAVADRGARSGAGAIARVARDGALPLSSNQQQLWYIHQLDTDSTAYNMPFAARLTGALDTGILERSLSAIAQRHETLRTSFSAVEGVPRQIIAAPPRPLPFQVIDLAALAAPDREAKLQQLIAEQAWQPFDLSRGPLFRMRLIRLDHHSWVLCGVIHHIVCDGWSVGVFMRELAAFYTSFAAGRPAALPELPIQYVEYAQWQRDWLRSEAFADQLAYWKQQLGGRLSVLDLPIASAQPSGRPFQSGRCTMVLATATSAALKALGEREGVTLFMTLLAAYQALLYYYSGQEELIIGTDVAHRNRPETEGLIGFFVNQLVLRGDLSGNPTFRAMLRRAQELTLAAYDHQDVPFDRVVEVINPERHADRAPLFQVKLVLQNAPTSELRLPDVILEPLEIDSGTAKFDLLLNLAEIDQCLTGMLEYRTDLFDAAAMAWLLEQYQLLLGTVISQPDITLEQIGRMLAEHDSQRQKSQADLLKQARLQKFSKIKRATL